ncbi:hypothetical protein J437_LFUL012555, partial [Ladona fulva]
PKLIFETDSSQTSELEYRVCLTTVIKSVNSGPLITKYLAFHFGKEKACEICPEHCEGRACDERGACCHEMCLGSCRGPHTTDCYVCRDVVYNGECMKRCPFNTYEYLNRRCIHEKECLNMPTPPELDVSKSWKTFNGSCILECPPGYVEVMVKGVDGNYTQCERCNDSCRKECEGASINSISSAQKFRGCTYIKGSLEIQIRGGKNIVKELEENLNMIEEIQGFLKVVRSFPLVSLNFLKNLSIIHGEHLEYDKYSLVVLDNQNLQELWNWSENRPIVQVKRGRPFFHFNPKLCLYKIEKLKQSPNFTNFTEYEVARNSNGDKVACNVTVLKANVTQLHANLAVIAWEHFQHYDPRSLLGYVLYSTEAPTKNVTLYDGRDACGGDGWVVDDVSVPVGDPKEIYHIITKLKPYTQYAFYVKTYTVATETTGAQSEIHYFRTKPDIPSNAVNLKAYSNSSDELVVEWQPPLYPNGNITHYLVVGTWEKDDQAFLEQRDYCFEPLALPDKKANVVVQEVNSKLTEKECMKECDERNARVNNKEEKDIQSQIRFEDFLHNKVYVKRPNRKTRDIVSGSEAMTSFRNTELLKMRESQMYRGIPDMMESSTLTLSSPYMNDHPSSSVTPSYDNSPGTSPIIPSFQYKVEGTKIVIGDLRHFAEYNIAVQACREETPEERREKAKNKNLADKTCSSKSIVTARTQKLEVADNVDQNQLSIEVSNQTAASVKIKWEEPEKPNGLVVTYQIEYTRTDIENFKPLVECITRRRYLENGRSYTLRNLQPGSYGLKLRATSLAGNGEFTKSKFFIIQDPPSNTRSEPVVLGIVGTLAILVALFGYYVYKKKFGPKTSDMKLIASVNPEYVSAVYIPDEWEVARKKIELIRELGQGSFGMVYEGIARDIVEGKAEMRCAIKTVNEHATDRERIEFLNEASVMKAFNTHHVVRLLGVVSQGQPTLVVMELMANGDLKTYLRSHRPDASAYHGRQPPTLKRILQMAIEIADGMAYLSAKKFVHRDLAARNCMVADDLTVKIGDFGMTRDIYETDYYRKGTKGLLPVRWMAPESLKDGVFTSYSDVWSYGVVLWEMATLASQPYQGLSNDQVLRYVIDGGVMERPENCPDKLYELMRICWQHKPVARPTFLTLVSMLEADVSPSFATVSFYHSHEGEEVRNHNTAPIVVPQVSRTLPQGARIAEVEDDDDEEEGEVGGATQTPTTPLRLTRDVEDFSVEDDSASERESSPDEDDDDEEEGGDGEGSKGFPRHRERKGSGGDGGAKMHGGSSGRWASTGGDGSKGMSVYSSDSSKGSKVSNGSAAANGYMMGRHNSSGVLKTTEC